MILADLYLVAVAAAEAASEAGAPDGNPLLTDAKWFVFYGLVAFLALVIRLGAHKGVFKALDDRSAAIAKELDDAAALRAEAEKLLADYRARHAAAEKEAQDIVDHAKSDAAALRADAESALAADLARRSAQAEDRIARAEAQALAEIRAAAVDAAIAAAETMLKADLAAPGRHSALIRQGVEDLARKRA